MIRRLNELIAIDRHSWHGRLTRYAFGDKHILHTPSICPYFWSVIASLILAPMKYGGEKIEGWGYGFHILLGFVGVILIAGVIFYPMLTILVALFGVGLYTILWFALGVGLWYEGKHPYVPKANYKKKKQQLKKEHRGLLWCWLKAKKDKVCPPIYELVLRDDKVVID